MIQGNLSGLNFNAEEVEPQNDFEPFAAGWKLSVISDKNVIPPYGVDGGSNGAGNRFTVLRDGAEQTLEVDLSVGDRPQLERIELVPRALTMATHTRATIRAVGVFAEHLSWRLAFYINVPFGLVALFLVIRYLDAPVKEEHGR